jgi:DNA polymerase III subunit epsilon
VTSTLEPKLAKQAKTPKTAGTRTPHGYTVIDVETTGLSPKNGDRVVEIAVVYVSEAGDVQDRWSTLVNPQRDVGPTRIHGITATDVLDAPTFAEIAPYVLRAINGRVVTAHNAPFDLRFLAHELVRSGVPLEQHPLSGLCTMQWSKSYLQSPSRKLVDCCAAADITLSLAHSAAADALAAAQLLSHYLQAAKGAPPWAPVIEDCVSYAWPPYRGDFAELRFARRGNAAPAREDRWLDLIVSGMPRAAEPRVDAYLSVLEMALLDGFLAEHEKQALVSVAQEHGLTRGEVMDVHSNYVRALAQVAWADGVVTSKERADLELVARLLNLPARDVDDALVAAETARAHGGPNAVELFATTGLQLEPGDRVCFTGEMKVERSVWEERSRSAGLVPGSLVKATKLLVAADPNSLSGKASKAQAYGIPIITEDAFDRLLRAEV